MNKNKIVTINGQHYDAHTGLPLGTNTAPVVATTKKSTAAAGVHTAPQKSQTLVRRVTKKPTPSPTSRPGRVAGRTMDIARSAKISRFAAHPTAPVVKAVATPDIPAVSHPAVAKAHKQQAAKKTAPALVSQSAKEIKNAAIEVALAKPAIKTPKKSFLKRHARLVNVFSVSIIIILLGVYLVYLNMPGLSVRIAASQVGINATYPEYKPDGYSLDGPVTFNDSQVMINFAANTGSSKFSLNQSKSSWDSSAVLDNIVRKKVGEKYITSQERGLTVYTYNGNAAWVNAGILYTIEGDAPLSGEQIRRIATSL